MEEQVKDINDFDFEGIKFRLGKKDMLLRLTLPGMKLLSKYYGSLDEAFLQFDKIGKDEKNIMNVEFFDIIAKFSHACVIHEENIKLEQLEKIIDFHKLMPLFKIIKNVIMGSTPKPKEVKDTVGELENQSK